MKDVSEMLCYRSIFGRNVGVLIGTIASIYIATKGFQYISKKITDKKRYTAADKVSTDSKKTDKNSGIASTSSPPSSTSSTPIHSDTRTVPSTSKQRKSKISESNSLLDLCVICQSPLSVAAGQVVNERTFESSATCSNCLSQTCKSPRCTIWLPKHDHWQCSNCHHFDCILYVRAYDWIFECLNQRFYENAAAADSVTKTPPPSPSSSSSLPKSPEATSATARATGTRIRDQSASTTQDDVMFELNDKSSPIPLKQRIRVREFIEELLSSMLGGPLDSVYVGQIYKNLEYLPILEHNQNPSDSYEHLRKIVHTIAQEVIKLPEFYNQKGFSSVDAKQVQSSFEPKVYEDLLATAVINKIVETYNDKKYENSSGIHSGGSDLDSSCHIDQTNQNFILSSRCSSSELRSDYSAFNERLRSPPSMKTADIIDEIFREKLGKENYQSSAAASVHSELSDYIQKHKIALPKFEFENAKDIDDVSNYNNSSRGGDDKDDDVDQDSDEIEQEFQSIYANSTAYDTNTSYSDISDNWLFRKIDTGSNSAVGGGGAGGRNGSTSSIISASSPVGMLVPSPTQDCPTLIGNQNADEISDLSENDEVSSDAEEQLQEEEDSDCDQHQPPPPKLGVSVPNPFDLPHVLVESKTLIGGKNEMNSFEQSKAALIDLLEPDSLVSEQSLTGQSPVISEAKNNLILIEDRSSPDHHHHSALMQTYPYKMDQNPFTSVRNNETTKTQTSSSKPYDTNSDLLIKFDSLEVCNGSGGGGGSNEQDSKDSNVVEIVSRNDKSALNVEYEADLRNDAVNVNRFTDKPQNASVDVVLREEANSKSTSAGAAAATPISSGAAIYNRQSASHANDEYTNDSLEFNVAIKGSIRNNSDNDTIEQDSLETSSKVAMSIETNNDNDDDGGNGDGKGTIIDGKTTQFLPFAHIGTNWSNEHAAVQEINTAATVDDDHNCNNNNTNNQFIEIESTNQTNVFNVDVQTNHSSITIDKQTNENKYHDIPGSIAEREHMKWKNAVELPNNPYSAEALQRRLSQTSHNKFTDIERLTSKFSTTTTSKTAPAAATTAKSQLETDEPTRTPSIPHDHMDKPIKVVLGLNEVNPERYGRDYYINNAKSASGSRALKTSGDLNLHRTIDDDGVEITGNNEDDDDDDDYNNNYTKIHQENDYNTSDSLLVGDIEVVTTEEETHRTTTAADSSYRTIQLTNNNQVKQFHTTTTTTTTTPATAATAKAIQVAENDPILNKATKLDHLCTSDRDYFLLESDTISADEYAKLSLGSETTVTSTDGTDSHVQQLSSLPHCDDSLSTTVSEESDCTVAVRVYDLNKRETKILRHDIIKRSRNPIGGGGSDLLNTPSSSAILNNLGNCCNNNSSSSNTSINNSDEINLSNQQQQEQEQLQQNVYTKPPRSPTNKLRSVHLNRNPRKLKMADVQLMNDAFGTSLDPKIIDELKRKNGEIREENTTNEITTTTTTSSVPDNSAVIVSVTENLLESERNASDVSADLPEKLANVEIKQQPNHDEHAIDATVTTVATNDDDNTAHVLVNDESANKRDESNNNNNTNNDINDNDTTTNTIITTTTISTTTSATSATIISEKNNNISNSNSSSTITTTNENVAIMENSEPLSIESMPLSPIETTNTKVDKSQIMVGTITHEQKSLSSSTANQQVKTFERSYEVIVQVNEHKEKSVIEEDVISALPSVKELARSFSTKRDPDARPERLQRPKTVWRNTYNGSNNNDINVKDQNGNSPHPSPETFVPHFNHSYHPVAPGYSITARSLSTKFREELKNVSDENTGRLSPERPSSPVLVPGILKNNVAFFENLRNK